MPVRNGRERNDEEGFSGKDGRTTILRYWSVRYPAGDGITTAGGRHTHREREGGVNSPILPAPEHPMH
jgi:hypothetical protein